MLTTRPPKPLAYMLNNFISGFIAMNKVPGRKYETEGTSWEVTTFDGFCVLKKVFTVVQSSMEIEQLSKCQYIYVITVCYVVPVLSDTSYCANFVMAVISPLGQTPDWWLNKWWNHLLVSLANPDPQVKSRENVMGSHCVPFC